MTKPIYRCMTKGIRGDTNALSHGLHWMGARRGILRVYEDHLTCGDWRIGYDEIDEAILYSFRSRVLQIPGFVLSIYTENETFHFGLNGWKFWNGELPFPVEREKTRLTLSVFSMIARLLILAYLIQLLYRWIFE